MEVPALENTLLTHPDPDHLKGLHFIASHFSVGEFWENYLKFESGRYVIYNEPLDGCILARSVEEVCRALADLRDETLPNADGARLVREQFSPENEAAIFRHCLEQYLGRALPSGRGPASARTTNPDARR